jgi:hypothetical protein
VHFDDETGLVTVVAGDRVRVMDGTDVHRAGVVALAYAASGPPTPLDLVWAAMGRTSLDDDHEGVSVQP